MRVAVASTVEESDGRKGHDLDRSSGARGGAAAAAGGGSGSARRVRSAARQDDAIVMPKLSAKAFAAIRAILHENAGIQLNDSKQALVVARLNKRLAHYGYETFDAYVEHLHEHDASGAELRTLINCITTNKTDFFREPHHFDFLQARVLEEAKARVARGAPRRLRIWSAGCSTGEEAWTIAMVVADALRGQGGWDVKILASDIDTDVLAHAEQAIYAGHRLEGISSTLRDRWFEPVGGGYRVRPELQELVTFRRINFMADPWPIRTRFDAIFCRNVTIYFDHATQDRFYRRLVKYLGPHAFLFAGHSENLGWLADIFSPVGGTVYAPHTHAAPQRASEPAAPAPRVHAPARPVATMTSERAQPARGPGAPSRAVDRTEGPAGAPGRISIQTGGVHATREHVRLRTLLGSCVTACIWDESARVGGMNHFMLPDGDDPLLPTRFGIHAMELLINELMKLGADRRRLKAKSFGAAAVIRSALGSGVAQRNEAFVRSFLQTEGIALVSSRFGGTTAMEVEFEPTTGRAFVRQAPSASDVSATEERYRTTLLEMASRRSSDVTLF